MFEQETQLIITTVQQRTIGNQPAIAIKDILAADIPYPLKTFFRADVESMLTDELNRFRKSSRFNFDHHEVHSMQNQINSVLVLHFSFDRTEFLHRLDDTVHLIINYLVRPQWTLTNVLFEKETAIASSLLTRMLRHFGPYEYLKDIVVRYVEDKNIPSFTRDEFSMFLRKIDGEYVRRKAGDELARLLSPLYEFLDYPNSSGNRPLPVKILIKYFEDKGLTAVVHRLEGEHVQGKQSFDRLELGNLLEDVRRTSGAFEAEKMVEQSASDQGAVQRAEQTDPVNQPVVTASDKQPKQPIKLLRTFDINDGNRRRFVRKIFLQNEQAFGAALDAMSSVPTWKEASKYIDEIFIQNDIDPYCPEAEQFIEIIYQQYHHQK